MSALAAVATLVAVAALALSAFLFSEVRAQRTELRQVRSLAIETADTVVLQHRTIGLVVSSQKNLLKVTTRLATPRRRAPARTIYSTP